MNKNIFKVADLFCGIGGFRLAINQLNQKCVFSSDIDKKCQDVYELNFKEKPVGDITKIKTGDIPSHDILLAGFPCQPFSYAGKKEGLNCENNGQLFFEIIRILNNHKPKMFLLENVKGIKSIDKGNTVKNIINSLEDIGYKTFSTVINSHDFGVPQYRERWYCVGFDKNIDFNFPIGDKKGTKIRDIIEKNLKDNSLALPEREKLLIKNHFSSNDIRVKHDWKYSRPESKIGKHGMYSYLKPDNTLRFHIGDRSKTQIQDFYYSSIDSVSAAIIVTRAPKLWDLKRHLSLTECKRLQGFPDNFKFDCVSNNIGKKLLGNSVTVPVIKSILKSMINKYQSIL